MDERALIARVKAGDQQAFCELMQAHQGNLYGLCLRMLRSRDDAMDALQETMLRAYKGIERFRDDAKLSTWLYRIADNVCLDMLRARKRRPSTSLDVLSEAGFDVPVDRAEQPEARALRAEQIRTLYRALDKLGPKHRSILVLRELQELEYEQISGVVGISVGTVKSRLFRARRELQKILLDMEQNGETRVKKEKK